MKPWQSETAGGGGSHPSTAIPGNGTGDLGAIQADLVAARDHAHQVMNEINSLRDQIHALEQQLAGSVHKAQEAADGAGVSAKTANDAADAAAQSAREAAEAEKLAAA